MYHILNDSFCKVYHKNEPTYYFIFEQPANPFLDGYAAQSGAMAMAPKLAVPFEVCTAK